MRTPRFLLHAFVILCLLLGQQVALSHAATHLGSTTSGSGNQDQQLPHQKVCDKCVQCAAMGAALLDTGPQFWAASTVLQYLLAPGASVHLSKPLRAFSSRAPPAFS
ncbi:MAG: hypothetical protein ABI612_22245, partial [Betaproteobacteria bacterium]